MTGNLGTSGGRVEMSLEGTRAGGKRDDERLYYGHVIYLYAWRGQVSLFHQLVNWRFLHWKHRSIAAG